MCIDLIHGVLYIELPAFVHLTSLRQRNCTDKEQKGCRTRWLDRLGHFNYYYYAYYYCIAATTTTTTTTSTTTTSLLIFTTTIIISVIIRLVQQTKTPTYALNGCFFFA